MSDDEEPSIEVSKVGVIAQTECCFCGLKETDVIASEIDPKKTICFKCIYKINFQTGKVPAGAVYCFKCKSIGGFTVEMLQGRKHAYTVAGRDFKGCVKYSKKEDIKVLVGSIKKVTCLECKSNIPRWALESTTHV